MQLWSYVLILSCFPAGMLYRTSIIFHKILLKFDGGCELLGYWASVGHFGGVAVAFHRHSCVYSVVFPLFAFFDFLLCFPFVIELYL